MRLLRNHLLDTYVAHWVVYRARFTASEHVAASLPWQASGEDGRNSYSIARACRWKSTMQSADICLAHMRLMQAEAAVIPVIW